MRIFLQGVRIILLAYFTIGTLISILALQRGDYGTKDPLISAIIAFTGAVILLFWGKIWKRTR